MCLQGDPENISRQKRSSPANSQQKSVQTAADVKLLIKEELRLLQNQVCAKDETLCRSGPKGTGAPNDNIVQNHLNIALLNVF